MRFGGGDGADDLVLNDAANGLWYGLKAMQGPVPYLAKIAHLVFNMDRMVGQDFEEGLANLQAVAQKPAP